MEVVFGGVTSWGWWLVVLGVGVGGWWLEVALAGSKMWQQPPELRHTAVVT